MKKTCSDDEVVNLYILEGPADCGNQFGYFKPGLLRAGRFAVVADGEYSNGGRGPSIVGDNSFATREAAEAEMQRLAD